MDLTEQDIIKRVLAENHLDAERALAELIAAIIERDARHSRTTDLRGPGPPILDQIIAALQFEHMANVRTHDRYAAEVKQNDPRVDDESFMTGVIAGARAHTQTALLEILATCQQLAEQQAEQAQEEARLLGKPDPTQRPDDPPPPMRLVTD